MRSAPVLFFCTALILPLLVAAQPSGDAGGDGKGGRIGERFKKADTNGDGKISKAEAQAGMPMVSRNFDAIDTNKDGFVTPDELRAAAEKRREQRQAAKGDMPK